SATDVSTLRRRKAVATIKTDTARVAAAKNHGALCPRLNAPPAFETYRNVSTPGITSTGPEANARSAQSFVQRSSRYAIAAVPNTIAAPRRATRSTCLPTRARLGVLDAEVDVREGLDPGLLDRLAASFADPVGPRVDLLERPVDLLEQVAHV